MTHLEKWRVPAETHSLDLSPMGNDEQTMIEITLIAGAIMLLSMVKKPTKPLFGQLTLSGELALDWVKNPTEIIAKKIWFCNVSALTE
ncbi:unnamed protein product [marine sediment metagenome]|uniref:Uncharacterized protein n=1 Tax=marine sediment metagenome TaxID=412755 RepID=X1IZW6_9ZZZZ